MTTQFANASYQEVIDLHTESDRVSVVGIHTPCSDTPYHMLKGFWDQFRKFKYNGCSLTMVPAAQLPADPLQVSYDAGEPTIDPRDMLNPIMFHGCHGDDMGAIINGLYAEPSSGSGQLIDTQLSDSTDHNMCIQTSGGIPISNIFESLYYRALTDKTWLKAHPQRGFRKAGLHPMIYSVASTMQIGNLNVPSSNILPNGMSHDPDTGDVSSVRSGVFGTTGASSTVSSISGYARPNFAIDSNVGVFTAPAQRVNTFLTPRLQRLGWMDTRQVVGTANSLTERVGGETGQTSDQGITNLYVKQSASLKPVYTPKIYMGMLMLPPAYKTEQHFRLILNHSFSFAKFRGASMQYDDFGTVNKAYAYFDYSGLDESKHIDLEPDQKGEDLDETDVKQ